jgi:hypothetical protein
VLYIVVVRGRFWSRPVIERQPVIWDLNLNIVKYKGMNKWHCIHVFIHYVAL